MAAQTMNNLELTRALQLLQGQMQHLENLLGVNIPKIEQDVATAAKKMFDALKAEVQPEDDEVPLIIEAHEPSRANHG